MMGVWALSDIMLLYNNSDFCSSCNFMDESGLFTCWIPDFLITCSMPVPGLTENKLWAYFEKTSKRPKFSKNPRHQK